MDENDPGPHEISEEGEDEPTRICSTPRGDMMMMTMLDSDPPARRTWHVAQDLLAILAAAAPPPESSQSQILNNNSGTSSERASQLMEELVNSIEEISGLQALGHSIEASLLSIGSRPLRAPPASKEVVANLPIITVTEEILVRFGSETECAVCKENLVINDKMQELPCKHLFHLLCLKPWLDKHNSCPVCRHELPTDDHAYESWKEREKEAEEARKCDANAPHGDSCIYI